VGMVFQDYALFPHLNVEENIGFGMRERGASRPAVKARVRELLELVRLPGMAQRYPAELSGGQRQRVAIARAVAYPPRVLLMDEPLGALDLKLREAMQQELRRIQRALSITTVSVTHDQTEAMIMSDHIVVMNHGRVEQIGSADEIYNRPRSRFVAEFVGRINFLAATVTGQDGGLLLLDVGGTRVVTPIAPAESAGDSRGETFALAIRPEHLEIRSPGDATGDRNSLGGRVTGTFFVGNLVHVMVEIGAGESVTAEVRPADGVPSIGEAVQLSWDPARAIPLH